MIILCLMFWVKEVSTKKQKQNINNPRKEPMLEYYQENYISHRVWPDLNNYSIEQKKS